MRLLLIVSMAILLGCNDPQAESEITDSGLYKINVPLEEFGNDNYVESVKYIFLDQEYLIGRIGRVLFFNNKIYIHDEMAGHLVVFSNEGKYLFHINNKGRGPMEYIKLTDFTIDGNKKVILIYDSYGHKILTFSIDKHKFVDEKKIDFHPIAFAWGADHLYFYNPYTINYPRNEKYHYSLIRTNPELKGEKRYFKVDEKMGSFLSNPNPKGFFYGNSLYFQNRFENVIYKLNKENVDAHCEILFAENSDYKHAVEDAISKGTRNTDRYHNCAAEIMKYCENKYFITFKYSRNKKIYYVIFSKDANKVIYHKSKLELSPISSMEKGIPFIVFPSYSNNDIFVSHIPNELMMYFRKDKIFIQSLEENIKDLQLIAKIRKYDANSNPVLAFYKFSQK